MASLLGELLQQYPYWCAAGFAVLPVVIVIFIIATLRKANYSAKVGCSLKFTITSILMTLVVIAVDMSLYPNGWVTFSSPTVYLLTMGCWIILPVTTFFLLCPDQAVIECVDYVQEDGNVIFYPPLIIFFSLNILILNAYIYCQQFNYIVEVTMARLIKSVVQTLYKLVFIQIIEPSCRIILQGITIGNLRQKPAATMFFMVITWFLSGILVLFWYYVLPDEPVENFSRFSCLLCLAIASFNVHASIFWGKMFYDYWYEFIITRTVAITIMVSAIVMIPASAPPPSEDKYYARTFKECTTTKSPSTTIPEPAQSMLMNEDLSLSQLQFLQYRDSEGQVRELKLKELLYTHCKDLADKFEYEIESVNCVNDVKNCCHQVFIAWRDRGAPGYPFTWNGLTKALKELGLKRIAAKIEEALPYGECHIL